eukprot:1136338-Pelagomonas_calceolata.AAC.2
MHTQSPVCTAAPPHKNSWPLYMHAHSTAHKHTRAGVGEHEHTPGTWHTRSWSPFMHAHPPVRGSVHLGGNQPARLAHRHEMPIEGHRGEGELGAQLEVDEATHGKLCRAVLGSTQAAAQGRPCWTGPSPVHHARAQPSQDHTDENVTTIFV